MRLVVAQLSASELDDVSAVRVLFQPLVNEAKVTRRMLGI